MLVGQVRAFVEWKYFFTLVWFVFNLIFYEFICMYVRVRARNRKYTV